jgi:hypothetical protein
VHQSKNFVKADPFFVQLNCFAAIFIFNVIFHRLFLLPFKFGRSLGD